MDAWSVYDSHARDVIHKAWGRLPANVRQALDGLRFIEDAAALKAVNAHADAGVMVVRVRPFGIVSDDAAVGVILHEVGHIAGNHHARISAGQMSHAQAEREADEYVKAWGCNDCLEQRRFYFGR
jgi:hypothetical protein